MFKARTLELSLDLQLSAAPLCHVAAVAEGRFLLGGGDLGLGLGERGESVKGDSTSALASFQARNFLLLHKGKLQGIKNHVIKIQCTSPSCPNDGCFFLRRLCFSGKAMAQTGCTEQLQEL